MRHLLFIASLTGLAPCATAQTNMAGAPPNYCAATQAKLGLGGAACQSPVLRGTSGSIGGSALAAGACASTTVNVSGLTTSMVLNATPVTYPGDGFYWRAYASSAGTATVLVCAAAAGTPTASAYNLAVAP